MTEKCKKEIIQYIDSKGFKLDKDKILSKCFPLFNKKNNRIARGYFIRSNAGDLKNLNQIHNKEGDDYIDCYFLEFIGHILRKYKVKKVKFLSTFGNNGEVKYESSDWKFENIKKT